MYNDKLSISTHGDMFYSYSYSFPSCLTQKLNSDIPKYHNPSRQASRPVKPREVLLTAMNVANILVIQHGDMTVQSCICIIENIASIR